MGAGVERFLVFPQIERFRRRVDAIAGGAVEVEADMDAVSFAELDRLIDMLEFVLLQSQPIRRIGPTKIRHGQPHEVEAPGGHPLEILFAEGRVAPFALDEFLEQVEAAPAGELPG